MNKFSAKSCERLTSCNTDLVLVMMSAIKLSRIDFGIAEGHRSVELQQKYFNEGKSKIDGITKKGKHNLTPSMAVDLYAWVNNKVDYRTHNFIYLAGLIEGVSSELHAAGTISHRIRWGGNWDQDGEILTDQTFDDLVHFELV